MSERVAAKVTVAIPTYNRADLLEETLRNVLDQSVTHIEVIVSDNASTDHTPAVVASIGDPRVHYTRLETNTGWHRNLSRCLRLGTAPFIVVFPDDDLMDRDNLAKKLRIVEENPDVDIVHSDYRLVGSDGVHVLQAAMRYVSASGVTIDPARIVLERLLTWSHWINPPSALIRREVLGDEGFREVDGTTAELSFFLGLALRARRIAYIPEPLVSRRIHAGADTVAQATHEFKRGTYRPTLTEIRDAIATKERFLDGSSASLPDVRPLRAASRGADRQLLWRRVAERSAPERTPIATIRALRDALAVDPGTLFAPGAIRYLVGGALGPAGRGLARGIRDLVSSPRFDVALSVTSEDGSQDGLTKILFVSHSALLFGAERSLYELVKGLHVERLARPEVVLPRRGPLLENLQQVPIGTWVVPYDAWASAPVPLRHRVNALLRNVSAVRSFRRLIRETRPALLVTNTVTIPSAAVAAHLEGVPHVWYAQEYGSAAYGAGFHWGRSISLKMIGVLSDLVLVPSRPLRDHFSRWIPRDRIRVLPYAAEVPERTLGSRDWSRRPFQIAVIGHMSNGKRQEDAIRALAILRRRHVDATLQLVGSGDGGYVAFLRRLVDELRVSEHVEFAGPVDDPFSVLTTSHIVLTCSPLEGLPRVIVEGMKAGCVVIGPRSGGTEDLIADRWNGLLYAPRDAHDLAEKIEAVCQDPALTEKLSETGRSWACHEFTVERFATTFMDLASETRTASSNPIHR